MHGYASQLPPRRAAAVSAMVADALRPILDLFIHSENGQNFRDPRRRNQPPEVAAVLMSFQHKLLDVYLNMPYINAYEDCWGAILSLCLEPLREGSSYLTAHTRRVVLLQLLPSLLNPQDDEIAAYVTCEDDALLAVRLF
jgi:hypothetical protein